MASHSRGEYGSAAPPADTGAPATSKFQSSDSVAEWRSREQLEPSPPSTSLAYWDTDDEEDSNTSSATGPKPSDLYGKFTWKIENFSEISKRELRSNVFEVGGYKWYILVYPQGCDVCNHLSLFLCVADYDKLLPGWSHFAQFTIAVVNKDPKKSKYSDTLHRFCKKEHDWGWKKFMELSKVLDGFTVADTLVIKAQVQVIRENPHRPFRCLDCQYRRELVRVYLTNVEGICRRFVEEKKDKLGKLMEDTVRWTSFQAFWSAVDDGARRRLAREKTDVILKAVVKRFFNEKEVTSTLVMDALYSGCKALDYLSRNKKGKINGVEMEEAVNPIVWVDKDTFVLAGDVLALLERAATESLPPYKDDKGPQNRTKDGGSGEDFGKDSVERDERRLTELGRRTVEMFVLAHLFSNRVEVAYREAVALKRQEELIREEEAAGQAENELRAKREAAEKEKRSKKKQAKQRRKDRKEKDKEAEEKRSRSEQEQRQRLEVGGSRTSKEHLLKQRELVALVTAEIGDDDDELSGLDPVDDIMGTLGPALEDGDLDRAGWDRDGPYSHSGMEASFSGALLDDSSSRRVSRKHQAALDDSSSTCSSDSLPSVRPTMNGSYGRPNLPEQSHVLLSRVRTRVDPDVYDNDGRLMEAEGMLRAAGLDSSGTGEASSSSTGLDSETVILSLKERVQWLEQRLLEKEEEAVLLQEQVSLLQHQIGFDGRTMVHNRGNESPDLGRVMDLGSTGHTSSEDGRADVPTSSNWLDSEEVLDVDKACSSGGSQQRVNKGLLSNGHLASSAGNHPVPSSLPGDVSSCSYGHQGGGKSDLKLPAPARSRSVDSSRPPRIGTQPIVGATSNSGFEDSTSGHGSVAVSVMTGSAAPSIGIPRPCSASGPGPGARPGISISNMHQPPPLSRSVSAAGRLGVGSDSGPSSNGATPVSPPVTPSYRNAAAGKMRSSSSGSVHSLHSSSERSSGVAGGAIPTPSTNGVGFSCMGNPALHSVPASNSSLPSTAGLTSPPSTPSQKVVSGSGHVGTLGNSLKGEGTSSSTFTAVAGTSAISALTEATLLTFGTVTPEVLHQQQHHHEDRMQQPRQESPVHSDALVQHQVELQQHLQQVPQQHMVRHPHQHQHHHQLQTNHLQQGLSENGITTSSMKTAINALENLNHSGGTEEFPHLDIINDLLDEDQGFSKALSAMLQKHPNPPFNRQLSLPASVALHKLNYGQLRSDSGANGDTERGDRGRSSEDERIRLHASEDRSNGLRETIRLQAPFTHTTLGRLHGQHGGLEGVAAHYWQLGNGGVPGGTGSRNGIEPHMGYPLVQGHHLSDCSGFSIGHNGYNVYAPSQQP